MFFLICMECQKPTHRVEGAFLNVFTLCGACRSAQEIIGQEREESAGEVQRLHFPAESAATYEGCSRGADFGRDHLPVVRAEDLMPLDPYYKMLADQKG